MRTLGLMFVSLLICTPVKAASKPHVVALGKTTTVKLSIGSSEDKSIDIVVRPLYVDTKLKEYTTGESHEITDREYVIRRAYRINDALPEDAHKTPKWLWQRGGWLLVDRISGKIVLVRLPDFDPSHSEVSWYRDYAAYCGISSNGEQVDAMVAEVGGKKALFRKELGKASPGDPGGNDCPAPRWERLPPRVTFTPKLGRSSVSM
jgi:hypothetical protein